MLNISQPFAHINSKLIVDGTKYEIEKFVVKFDQSVDYKGQPQHEVRGWAGTCYSGSIG